MYQVQINEERWKNHIQYDWWKYIVGILLTILIWSLVTAMTRPQTPPDKKIEVFMVGDYLLDDFSEELSDDILEDFPNLEEVNTMNIMLGAESEIDYVGRQKLMVMLGSQSGDLFAFEESEFQKVAEQGAFLPLDDYLDELGIDIDPEELEKGKFTVVDDGETHYYGIPMKDLKLFEGSGYDVSDKLIGIMAYSENQSTALEVLKWILNDGSK